MRHWEQVALAMLVCSLFELALPDFLKVVTDCYHHWDSPLNISTSIPPQSSINPPQSSRKKCEEGPLCHSFSFKGDSVPVGACWLFPATAQLKEVADVKANSGPKVCEAAVVKEAPDAVPPASGEGSGWACGWG